MGRLSASAHGALAVVTLKVFASTSGAVNGHSHIPLFLADNAALGRLART